MGKVIDGIRVALHGLFHHEGAGATTDAPPLAPDERKPSCFALEEERGEGWKGSGAMKSEVNEKRPTL
jgi:hypothetical protein